MFGPGSYARISAVTVLAVLVCGLALEGAGRVFIYLNYGFPNKSYGIYRGDPKLKGRLRENSYNLRKQFNNLAIQAVEDVALERPAGVGRVLVYGGSAAFCHNLPTGQGWPARLQAELRRRGMADVQVLNAGDAGWSLAHAYQRALGELSALKPDVMLFYSGFNETRNAGELKVESVDLAAAMKQGRIGVFSRSTLQAGFLFRNSVLYKVWLSKFYAPHVRPILIQARRMVRPKAKKPTLSGMRIPDDIMAHYLATLNAFILLTRAAGATPVFVTQAADPKHVSASHRADYSRRAAKQARLWGALVADTQPLITDYPGETSDLLIDTGFHFTKQGSVRLAEHLTNAVDWAALLPRGR